MATTEQKIDILLSQLTLEEKVSLCHAGSKFAVDGIPRLGIPEFTMSDGPHGVRREIERDSWDPVETDTDFATYLPPGTSLAATWNPELARRFGETLGAEARARGKDVILGPGINIIRTPVCGRNFEYYGEDPFQISRMVVPAIEGIQSQDVAACVKHYAANSQELNRNGVDAQMDERTLREIYLPGFRAAIVEGKALTIMGGYNLFRGQHCCHNKTLLVDILKGEWGFDGSVISDWAGTYSTTEAAQCGLDIEMGTPPPYENYFLARPFREAIERGELDEALLDDKVRRNLRVMLRIGCFDPERKPGALNIRRHQETALDIARESLVLLKNAPGGDGRCLLPLEKAAVQRLVVIGDNATVRHALGGNSSGVKSLYEVTPLEGLQNLLAGNGTEIHHFRGYPPQIGAIRPIPAEHLGIADEGAGTHGWKGRYYANRDMAGEPLHRADADIDFHWGERGPVLTTRDETGAARDVELPAPGYSVVWETTLTPPHGGLHTFILRGANHAGLLINGTPFIQRWENGGENLVSLQIELEAGRAYPLRVELRPAEAGVDKDVAVKLGWLPPGEENAATDGESQAALREEILETARSADAVLFFGGLNHQYDVEGSDRLDMALHDGQNELLAELLAVPEIAAKTAVTLVGGSPMEMPWINAARAVLHAGYAGMEGGNAIAEALFGEVNPSGKLTMTFPKTLADSPAHALGDYAADACRYEEGIFVGYRWFDAKGIEPLFPFGHGLSYTTFGLGPLSVQRVGGEGESTLRVRLTVTNTGPRAGAEVVQLYVGQQNPSVPRPVRELKGFAKVALAPGQTTGVEFLLLPEAFAYWSTEEGSWALDVDDFVLEAGTSSRDIRSRETVNLSILTA